VYRPIFITLGHVNVFSPVSTRQLHLVAAGITIGTANLTTDEFRPGKVRKDMRLQDLNQTIYNWWARVYGR
jgi:hypothetical protein